MALITFPSHSTPHPSFPRLNYRKIFQTLITSSSRFKHAADFAGTHSRFHSKIKWRKKLGVATDLKRSGWRLMEAKCKAAEIERGGESPSTGVVKVAERSKVVALVAAVMCLCNANRIVMAVAVVPWAELYGWSSSFVGVVQSSFLWGYIFSSVIGGALADKYGGKTVMAWGVALWSFFTLLTPWAAGHSAATLLVVRALFGLAAGVAFPSMNLILSRWSPIHERSRAVGVSMAGFQLGNVLGLCLTPVVIALIGVSGPFVLFSSLALLWLSMWVYGVTNDPRNSTSISKAELQLIQAGKSDSSVSSGKFPPVGLLLSKRPSWAIIFANFTNNWGYLVLLSWMPIYFKTVLNVDLKQAAWFSAVPWGVMAVSSCIAGAASDNLIKSGCPLIVVRKIMQSIGFIGPGLSLLCLNYATTPALASVILTVALSLSSFTQAGYFLNIQDIAPQSAGLLHGISNAAGTLAAIISTIGAGYFVEWFGSFKAFLTLTAMIYFSASIFYNLFAVGDPVV